MHYHLSMTTFPARKSEQLRFDACKKDDTVWFVGGYTIAGNWDSFGRRAKVVGISVGANGGVLVKPDNDPTNNYLVTWLMTQADIQETLAKAPNREAKEYFLATLQLQPGDLAEEREPAPKAKPAATRSRLESLTKAELIERVLALESELAALKA